jgi:hypothetical protein
MLLVCAADRDLTRTPGAALTQALLLESTSADSEGDVVLPSLLRRKRGCDLTKAHLLALCRVWRYRSSAWCAGACTHACPPFRERVALTL